MSDLAINIQGLGKRYRIGGQYYLYKTFKEQITSKATAPIRAARSLISRNGHGKNGNGNGNGNTIWALKDVSFEIKRGEVIGIIGRNGAGKSTLLKILSRITEPTEGYVDLNGRVASLLEVGTGFQAELTGRENIFLNGSILGMKHAEILRKFDEIVAFAEVEKFINTPVKHYSSGMYLRLAFAVAAHLEPEILLVDEVLAVGDLAFQKKCLGKMGDIATEGRTVLFVSHNMAAIQRLCPTSLLLDGGRLVKSGRTDEVVTDYLSMSSETIKPNQWVDVSRSHRAGSGEVRFKSFKYSGPSDCELAGPNSLDALEITMELVSNAPRSVGSIAATIYDKHGTKLINADTLSLGLSTRLNQGSNLVTIKIDQLFLNSGVYTIGLWTADPIAGLFDHVESAGQIEVVAPVSNGFGETPVSDGLIPCSFDVVSLH